MIRIPPVHSSEDRQIFPAGTFYSPHGRIHCHTQCQVAGVRLIACTQIKWLLQSGFLRAGQVILSCEDIQQHSWPHPPDASSTSILVAAKNVFKHCQMSPEKQSLPTAHLPASALGVSLPKQSSAPSGSRDNDSITQSLVCVSAHTVPKYVKHLGYSHLILGILQLCNDAISRETTKCLSAIGIIILVCFSGLE